LGIEGTEFRGDRFVRFYFADGNSSALFAQAWQGICR